MLLLCAAAFGLGAADARAAACDGDLQSRREERLHGWDELPSFRAATLPPRFTAALHASPSARKANARHGRGETLAFDFSRTQTGGNGWGIQAFFLRRVVAALFPRAVFRERAPRGRTKVVLTLYDSVLTDKRTDTDVDMVALKTANPGPELPDRARIRRKLGLPVEALIVSLYASWTHNASAMDHVVGLLGDGLADVVVYSTQDGSAPPSWELTRLRELGVAYSDSETHADRRETVRSPSVVFNDTRGRMPFIHAAADVVVILGMANGIEALHAGRPTLVTKTAPRGFSQRRWNALLREMNRTGGLRTFDNYEDLAERLRSGEYAAPTSSLYEDPRVLTRLIDGILAVVDDAAEAG